MSNDKYWIVEYRLPIQIDDASDANEAAEKASRILYNETGVEVSNWFARVFEYGGDVEDIGIQAEWFFNPTGVAARVWDQNHAEHDEIVKGMKKDG